MKCVILGIQRSAGTFEASDKRQIEYDNTNLQIARRPTGNGREDKVNGCMVETVKVKSPVFGRFMQSIGVAVSTDLLGAIINVSYDNRGRVEDLDLLCHKLERKDGDKYADLPKV